MYDPHRRNYWQNRKNLYPHLCVSTKKQKGEHLVWNTYTELNDNVKEEEQKTITLK